MLACLRFGNSANPAYLVMVEENGEPPFVLVSFDKLTGSYVATTRYSTQELDELNISTTLGVATHTRVPQEITDVLEGEVVSIDPVLKGVKVKKPTIDRQKLYNHFK